MGAACDPMRHCVVLLLGARLSQRMHEAEADALFSRDASSG